MLAQDIGQLPPGVAAQHRSAKAIHDDQDAPSALSPQLTKLGDQTCDCYRVRIRHDDQGRGVTQQKPGNQISRRRVLGFDQGRIEWAGQIKDLVIASLVVGS